MLATVCCIALSVWMDGVAGDLHARRALAAYILGAELVYFSSLGCRDTYTSHVANAFLAAGTGAAQPARRRVAAEAVCVPVMLNERVEWFGKAQTVGPGL